MYLGLNSIDDGPERPKEKTKTKYKNLQGSKRGKCHDGSDGFTWWW
jgi:hypothetical protein